LEQFENLYVERERERGRERKREREKFRINKLLNACSIIKCYLVTRFIKIDVI